MPDYIEIILRTFGAFFILIITSIFAAKLVTINYILQNYILLLLIDENK